MKKQILIAGLMVASVTAFAQKKEIKKADKAMKTGNVTEALTYLNQAEALIGSADETQKVQIYVMKAEALLTNSATASYDNIKMAAESMKKAKALGPKGAMVERMESLQRELRVGLVNSAISDQNAKNFKSASEKLYMSYMNSPKDTADLYYAAGNAVNDKDFDTALTYYKDLLDLGFTGITTQYISTDPEGKEVVRYTADERDKDVLLFKHTFPKETKTKSLRGDVLQKVTLILIDKGQNEDAIAIMKEARAANPDDMNLVRAEADLAYKMGDIEKYSSLMNEVAKSDPNNPELFYNLGVSAGQIGQTEKAMEYYKKALEIDPNHALSQINIAAAMLAGEGKIVEEMNGLGMSRKDEQRYDELKAKRTQLYTNVLPYLESAVKLKPDNVELVRTLMNIYSQVGRDADFKAMKSKLKTMEGGQ